jgi:DNA repair exonuclease SbcCD ATPase subunit
VNRLDIQALQQNAFKTQAHLQLVQNELLELQQEYDKLKTMHHNHMNFAQADIESLHVQIKSKIDLEMKLSQDLSALNTELIRRDDQIKTFQSRYVLLMKDLAIGKGLMESLASGN